MKPNQKANPVELMLVSLFYVKYRHKIAMCSKPAQGYMWSAKCNNTINGKCKVDKKTLKQSGVRYILNQGKLCLMVEGGE